MYSYDQVSLFVSIQYFKKENHYSSQYVNGVISNAINLYYSKSGDTASLRERMCVARERERERL